MLKNVANYIRSLVALMDMPEGEVINRQYDTPQIKPSRKLDQTSNKTNRTDFSRNYMREYRSQGKDYQKMSPELKKRRREQRKRQKEHLKHYKPMMAHLLDQELSFWKNAGIIVEHEEFEALCNRRGFNDEERIMLAEELSDLNLILF